MNKLFLILTGFALLSVQACNNAPKNTTEEKTPVTAESKVETSKKHTAAIHITKEEFLKKVANYEQNSETWVYLGDKPCIIDFYADWCRPCKIAGPILEELAQEYEGEIYVYKVNTEEERELAGAFNISSIPAFLLVPMDGNPQMSAGIAQTPEETKAMFKKIIDEVLLKK